MKLKLSTQIIISFLIIIGCCMISFWIIFKLSSDVEQNAELFTKSETVLRHSSNIHITIQSMDNAFRGFLLTDKEKFLSAYYKGLDTLPSLFRNEKLLIKDSPGQLALMDSIEMLHERWMLYSKELLKAKFDRLDPNVISFEYDTLLENKLKKGVGKRIVEDVSYMLSRFEFNELEKSRVNRERLGNSMSNAKSISLFLAAITAFIGMVSAYYITRIISKRINEMLQLAGKISEGNFDHIEDDKKDELTELSHSLNRMSDKLKRSFSELDQFAHVVSHDLKAPLRGINNVISWIDEDFKDEMSPRLIEYTNKIKGRVHRMDDLITGLLEYSKIRAVKGNIELVEVKSLLEEVVDSIVPDNFNVVIENPMPKLYTEKLRLQQVFSNLISNSVKYNESEQGNIWISSRVLDGYIEFVVKDNGVGIAPEHHQKIFGMFQTLRDKNEKESTGIGLPIVRRIIEERQGTIKVISSIGKGTSMVFTWPK